MTQTQTEALSLADKLNSLCVAEFAWETLNHAAVLLRRLHAEMALLNEVNAQLCEQNDSVGKACAELEAELVREAQRTAAERLRADQMTEQHRMQSAMNAEARAALAQLREKRQPLSDEQIDAALQAWFGNVLGNSAEYRYRMRGAIEAAHNITGEPA